MTLSLAFEATVMVILAGWLMITYDEPFGRAAYLGAFHAVSTFDNTGFSLDADSLHGFAADGWVLIPIAIAAICRRVASLRPEPPAALLTP